MKAITVHQPWASLIALGHKTIETRPSPPNGPMRPDGVRGLPGLSIEHGERIAIHASSERWGISSARADMVRDHLPRSAYQTLNEVVADPEDCGTHTEYPVGAVVATAVVANAVQVQELPPDGGGLLWPFILSDPAYGGATPDQTPTLSLWLGQDGPQEWIDGTLGDFRPGRWGWLLTDVRRITPVPCKGKQGVWALPINVHARVQIAEAVRHG